MAELGLFGSGKFAPLMSRADHTQIVEADGMWTWFLPVALVLTALVAMEVAAYE